MLETVMTRKAFSTPHWQNWSKIEIRCLPTNGWTVIHFSFNNLEFWLCECLCLLELPRIPLPVRWRWRGCLLCFKLGKTEMGVQRVQNTASWTFAVGMPFCWHMFGHRVLFCTRDMVCCTPIQKRSAGRTCKLLTKFETLLQFLA